MARWHVGTLARANAAALALNRKPWGGRGRCGQRRNATIAPIAQHIDRRGTPCGCPHCHALPSNKRHDRHVWSLKGNAWQCAAMRGNARRCGPCSHWHALMCIAGTHEGCPYDRCMHGRARRTMRAMRAMGNDGNDRHVMIVAGQCGALRAMRGMAGDGAMPPLLPLQHIDRRGTHEGCPHCHALPSNKRHDRHVWSLQGNVWQCGALRATVQCPHCPHCATHRS